LKIKVSFLSDYVTKSFNRYLKDYDVFHYDIAQIETTLMQKIDSDVLIIILNNEYSELENKMTEFLFVGRLLNQKGILYFLEAAQKVLKQGISAQFTIVGEHEDNNSDYIDKAILNKYIKNPNINYLGTVSPDEMPIIISSSTCVVLPSYLREGVPRSLLEAASMGRPIITTNNVGCKEVVDEGKNGYKCEVRNSLCLSEKMIKFINLDIGEKVLMGQYGRKKMEKEFAEKIVLDAYVKAIKDK
jgi:glycosyltransferase involved in cell wall biosynthesis